jgi:hypothetical protein
MIELNLEQQRAIARGEPVRIVDSMTHDTLRTRTWLRALMRLVSRL